MPRNSSEDEAREPDDHKDGERMAKVGRSRVLRETREDIGEADDLEEIDDADIVEITDIDGEDKR